MQYYWLFYFSDTILSKSSISGIRLFCPFGRFVSETKPISQSLRTNGKIFPGWSKNLDGLIFLCTIYWEWRKLTASNIWIVKVSLNISENISVLFSWNYLKIPSRLPEHNSISYTKKRFTLIEVFDKLFLLTIILVR